MPTPKKFVNIEMKPVAKLPRSAFEVNKVEAQSGGQSQDKASKTSKKQSHTN